MAEYPIIFSAPMVRAILDGRKTMTRRLAWTGREKRWSEYFEAEMSSGPKCATVWQRVQPGDRLWVREAWTISVLHDGKRFIYAADDDRTRRTMLYRWYSPIHMPRRASRITLEVTATRIERLQEISDDDVEAEGAIIGGVQDWDCQTHGEHCHCGESSPQDVFRRLWDSLHKPPHAWADNPEIVVLSFRRMEP